MKTLVYTALDSDDGRRAAFIVRARLGVSHRQSASARRGDNLFVNGVPVHMDAVVRAGDRIEIWLEDTARETAAPEEGEVNLVYIDDDILILDKPAPLACQSTPKQPLGTLENRLAYRFGEGFVFRPLNRLDKGTSGLMAAAMHPHACQRLQKTLHTDDFTREYLAVVEGHLTGAGIIDLPIGKAEGATVRRQIDFVNGQRAVTHYETLCSGHRSLVRLRLETGRTHQIRVHLSAMGFPVAGDFLYGTELDALPNRFALHSARIALIQPVTGARIEFVSKLPEALEKLL